MGPHDVVEFGDRPGWWWQVLCYWSIEPVLGQGRADGEMLARQQAEAQMLAASQALMAIIIGPRGQLQRCMRTAGGDLRWTPAQ